MALLQAYQQFLAAPNSCLLADGASLHYIATLTTLNEPNVIIKHLASQGKVLKKKVEKVISSFESATSLCAEIETEIEFLEGGGAYLPGLDDNFLSDKVVQIPIVHIVQFDEQGKINQIRLHWEQASVLKQIEVIGSRGRNWPIRDGKDQVRIIHNSVHSSGLPTGSRPASSRRSHASSVNSATGDPHATLSLFQPRSIPEEDTPKKSGGPGVRMSAKPHQRNLEGMLAGEGEDIPPPGSPSAGGRSRSPSKNSEGRPKTGAGKNYHPIRLFDEQPHVPEPSPVKTNPNKYNHFEFGNGETAPTTGPKTTRAKHNSSWGFEDFVTPNKPKAKPLAANRTQRNFGWSDDEVSSSHDRRDGSFESDLTTQQEEVRKSPPIRPVVHQERPDSKAHFDFTDDASPAPAARPSSRKQNTGLYTDNVVENENASAKPGSGPTAVNVNLTNRSKDFGPHFEMRDDSPATGRTGPPVERPVDHNRARVIKGLDPNWELYENSPKHNNSSNKENHFGDPAADDSTRQKGINIGGDGMGGGKGTKRDYIFGGASDDESSSLSQQKLPTAVPGRNRTAQHATESGDGQSTARSNGGARAKGINIGGDGMGGGKGTRRDYIFGGASDDDEAESLQQQTQPRQRTGKTAAPASQGDKSGGGFWDF